MPHFRVSASFVCHDLKLSDVADVEVDADSPPSPEAAQGLLWPAAKVIVARYAADDAFVHRIDWTSEPSVEAVGVA